MSDELQQLKQLGTMKNAQSVRKSYAKTPEQIVSNLLEDNIKWLKDNQYTRKNAKGNPSSPSKCFVDRGGMVEVFALYMRKRVELGEGYNCVEVPRDKLGEALGIIKKMVDTGQLGAQLAKLKAMAPRSKARGAN